MVDNEFKGPMPCPRSNCDGEVIFKVGKSVAQCQNGHVITRQSYPNMIKIKEVREALTATAR